MPASCGNHFFWRSRRPRAVNGRRASSPCEIEDGYGDLDTLLAKLKEEAVGHFASGWAWLVLDRDALKITSLHDADTPVAVHEGMKPC